MRAALWSLTAFVFTVALAIKLLPWVALAVAGSLVIWILWTLTGPAIAAWSQRRDRHQALAARADQQHRQVMRGNPQGIYGDLETVKHMREILQWPRPPQPKKRSTRPNNAMGPITRPSGRRQPSASPGPPIARPTRTGAPTVPDAAPTGSSTAPTEPTV